MTLQANHGDLVEHAKDFADRQGFTYSIIDDDHVIGCLYIYPSKSSTHDASVKSWVRGSRAEMDMVIWRSVSRWLVEKWPFRNPLYAERKGDPGSADTTG
jgi:hypothetical protein